jgi:hypothetical protein
VFYVSPDVDPAAAESQLDELAALR